MENIQTKSLLLPKIISTFLSAEKLETVQF